MRSSTGASSAFASCDSYGEESDDDDCQVVGVRPPPGGSRKSGYSSWSAWEVKRKARGGSELVDDNQQSLRRQWEAATLRRRTCPPMRSQGSKAGTNSPGSVHSSANAGGESGAAETVQSNGHVSPVKDASLHTLSETTSTDSVLQASAVEPRDNGDEVASASTKSPCPAPAPAPACSTNSVFREDPPPDMASPPKPPRKGSKRRYDATLTEMELRTYETDGASVSGHGGMNSMKHVHVGDSGARDGVGVSSVKHMDNGHRGDRIGITSMQHMDNGDAARGSVLVEEQDIVGAKEKLKETVDFKLADEEEWARRQQELQKQALEARRLRERKRAETDRKNEVELRQKQRLEEIRQTQQKEERNMGLKDQIRGKVQADLERLASGCRDMASLLRLLNIPVDGGPSPSLQQVNAAYKKALLRYHPDRTSSLVRGDPRRQVEAEETFKLITRMKPILKPSSIFTAMTAR